MAWHTYISEMCKTKTDFKIKFSHLVRLNSKKKRR